VVISGIAEAAASGIASIFAIHNRGGNMTFKALGFVVTVLAVLVLGLGATGLCASDQMTTNGKVNIPGKKQIVVKDGFLSISLKDADLEAVLKDIARQSGITITSNAPIKDKVTLQFENMALEQGLKRILKNHNYFFTYLKNNDGDNEKEEFILDGVILSTTSTLNETANLETLVTPKQDNLSPTRPSGQYVSSDLIKTIEQAWERMAKGDFGLEEMNKLFEETGIDQIMGKDGIVLEKLEKGKSGKNEVKKPVEK
jgi:hypothetical protein